MYSIMHLASQFLRFKDFERALIVVLGGILSMSESPTNERVSLFVTHTWTVDESFGVILGCIPHVNPSTLRRRNSKMPIHRAFSEIWPIYSWCFVSQRQSPLFAVSLQRMNGPSTECNKYWPPEKNMLLLTIITFSLWRGGFLCCQ